MSTLPKQTLFEESTAITRREPSPLEILSSAVEKGAGIDTIERLVALQERMQLREAELQFNEAMSRVQASMRAVSADLDNPQTRSKYASYSQLDKAIRPAYSKEGFSLSFDTGDSPIQDVLRVLCHVSRGGYTRTYKADMPADGKGAKGGDVMTKTHATGAAMSYGMRYLLKMIFNVAVGEDDNDGNGSEEQWVEEFISAINDSSSMDELQRVFREGYQKATKSNNQRAQRALITAKDARKKHVA